MHSHPKISLRIGFGQPIQNHRRAEVDSKFGSLDKAGLPSSLTLFAEQALKRQERLAALPQSPLKSLKQKPVATASMNLLLVHRKRSQGQFENRKGEKQSYGPFRSKSRVLAWSKPPRILKTLRVSGRLAGGPREPSACEETPANPD